MKPVRAEFRPRRGVGRSTRVVLSVLAVCALGSVGFAARERVLLVSLRARVADLEEARRSGRTPAAPPRPPPPYEASARQMLAERDAPWAAMLRTLESASVIGVTPSLVEFNSMDAGARVELAYTDTTALFDYLQRINEGLPPAESAGRWNLVQVRSPPGGTASPAAPGAPMSVGGAPIAGQSVASIQSNWFGKGGLNPGAKND